MKKSALSAVCGVVLALTTTVSAHADPAPGSSSAPGAATPVRNAAVSCTGAAALSAPSGYCPTTTKGPTTPSIAKAPSDKSAAYPGVGPRDCEGHSPTFPLYTCYFGSDLRKKNIALVGNSHAAQWLPALQKQAAYRGWHITTFLVSSCAFSNVRQRWPEATQTACLDWVRKVAQLLARSSYDLIVMSSKISQLAAGTSTLKGSYQPYYAGYWSVLNILHKAHKRVLVLHDTPAPIRNIPTCLAQHPTNYAACNGPRSSWSPNDPAPAAARSFDDPRIITADLTDHICQRTTCQAVVGGEVVYYDGSHLTATFNRSLGSYLGVYLIHALKTP